MNTSLASESTRVSCEVIQIDEESVPAGELPEGGKGRRARILLILLLAGLVAAGIVFIPAPSQAAEISIGISVRVGPPPIPVYVQPPCPGPGYMWTPGYWAYDPDGGYFWVPGTWVMAPTPMMLWTPGYWGWNGVAFIWHAGYWGPHVGFYGGINYGFGYTGVGFVGGEWRGGTFFYNRAVVNFGGAQFTNVYDRRVVDNFAVNRVSFNGGPGGLGARPTSGELAAEREHHVIATEVQHQNEVAAHGDHSQFASVNHGVPGVAATERAGKFQGANVVHSSRAGGAINPEVYHPAGPGREETHAMGRTPNPAGGGTHEVMMAHNPSTMHNPGTSRPGPPESEYHSKAPSHDEPSYGKATSPRGEPTHAAHPTHPAESHTRQPQSRGQSSQPSRGGEGEKHEGKPHH